MNHQQKELFFEKLGRMIDHKELIKLLLSDKRDKTSELKRIIVSLVELKKGYCLHFVYRHATKDITKNYGFAEGISLVREALEKDFYNAEVSATSENLSLTCNEQGNLKLRTSASTLLPPTSFSHDRTKERLIEADRNIYLRELGIVNDFWEIRREMSDKYKQINRYIELLEPYLRERSFSDTCKIVDMGAGKGYLTFALYDYLANKQQKDIRMTGIEFRGDLVASCNDIARKANFHNLTFLQGTIAETTLEHIDILIALHACDTATDDAIYRGITSGASLIVCAPCCHKQIRKEMSVTNELRSVLKYGILKERQAELLTDGIRAMLLEASGYKTNVFEFISTEHTPKNILIVGQKVPGYQPDRPQLMANLAAIKQLYGIKKHYLETLLASD